MTVEEIHFQDLKKKTPAELLAFAEELEVENASTLRKQDMMLSILKLLADDDAARRIALHIATINSRPDRIGVGVEASLHDEWTARRC